MRRLDSVLDADGLVLRVERQRRRNERSVKRRAELVRGRSFFQLPTDNRRDVKCFRNGLGGAILLRRHA